MNGDVRWAGPTLEPALRSLTPRQREALRLKYALLLSRKEMAEELNISETNVSKLLTRARKNISEYLQLWTPSLAKAFPVPTRKKIRKQQESPPIDDEALRTVNALIEDFLTKEREATTDAERKHARHRLFQLHTIRKNVEFALEVSLGRPKAMREVSPHVFKCAICRRAFCKHFSLG